MQAGIGAREGGEGQRRGDIQARKRKRGDNQARKRKCAPCSHKLGACGTKGPLTSTRRWQTVLGVSGLGRGA